MKKRIIPIVLLLVLSVSLRASAVEPRMKEAIPSLTFDGTTATCSVCITDFGHSIQATLTLWRGNRVIGSWSDEATSVLFISETCTVTKGTAYTLKVTGTIDGVPIQGVSVSGTC